MYTSCEFFRSVDTQLASLSIFKISYTSVARFVRRFPLSCNSRYTNHACSYLRATYMRVIIAKTRERERESVPFLREIVRENRLTYFTSSSSHHQLRHITQHIIHRAYEERVPVVLPTINSVRAPSYAPPPYSSGQYIVKLNKLQSSIHLSKVRAS